MTPITTTARTQVRVELKLESGIALIHVTPAALCPQCGERNEVFVAAGRDCSPCLRCHLAEERRVRKERDASFGAPAETVQETTDRVMLRRNLVEQAVDAEQQKLNTTIAEGRDLLFTAIANATVANLAVKVAEHVVKEARA